MGGACVAVSVLSVILRLAGVLPSGWATAVVIAVTAIGLRVFIRYTGRSASTVHRARIAKFIALSGLALSMTTLFASLPVLLRGGGSDHFVENVFAHLWTVAILVAIAGTARTLNWMAFLGMGLTGFLAVTGIAFAIGRPVIEKLGDDSVFASAFYVPFTEEVLKALPAVLILVLAARQMRTRPSALELALLGAVLGAGFALYEDTQYHRGGFSFTAMPIASLVNPTAVDDSSGLNITYFSAGHMVYTTLIVFGLAIGVLYRRQYRWARLAILLTFADVLLEHCTQNYAGFVAIGKGNTALFDAMRVVTLWGWLSTVLLVGGIVLVARTERRATGGGRPLAQRLVSGFWLRPASAQYAAAALARAQLGYVQAQGVAR
jgi:RsiW-degrading membrane proteinase PrsW (M82 family)